MAYFGIRDVTAASMFAAFWAVLNAYVAPVFWALTRTPFLCDILAVTALVLAAWWTGKRGAAALTGLIATMVTLALMPSALQFLGFTAASVFFDLATGLIGQRHRFGSDAASAISLLSISALSTGIAGLVIGIFFMGLSSTAAIAVFAGFHAAGGAMGGALGLALVNGLRARRMLPAKVAA